LDLEIVLGAVPPNVQPRGLFLQPARRLVETSHDVIGFAFILDCASMSRLFDQGFTFPLAYFRTALPRSQQRRLLQGSAWRQAGGTQAMIATVVITRKAKPNARAARRVLPLAPPGVAGWFNCRRFL